MSPTQKEEQRKKEKETAKRLRDTGRTHDEIGRMLGVSRQTISLWLEPKKELESIANDSGTLQLPNSKVKVDPTHKEVIYRRCAINKEPLRQVAADYGVSHTQIGNIVSQVDKKLKKNAEIEALLKATSPAPPDNRGQGRGGKKSSSHTEPDFAKATEELGDTVPVGAAEHRTGAGELLERVKVQRGEAA